MYASGTIAANVRPLRPVLVVVRWWIWADRDKYCVAVVQSAEMQFYVDVSSLLSSRKVLSLKILGDQFTTSRRICLRSRIWRKQNGNWRSCIVSLESLSYVTHTVPVWWCSCRCRLVATRLKPGFHKRQPIGMLGRRSGNHDCLLANASACVSCGFRLRNARNASDCVWMETGLETVL